MTGIFGRRRLYDKKADKEVVTKEVKEVKAMVARLEGRIYDFALGKPPAPLHKEVVDLINNNK